MAKQTLKLNSQILDEASAWFTEFTAGGLDAAAQSEFDAWLRRSPEHVQAYLQIAALWEDADLLSAHEEFDAADLIARAKREMNVYPLEPVARADSFSLSAHGLPPALSESPWNLPSPLGREARGIAPASRTNRFGHGHRPLLAFATSGTLLLTAAIALYLHRGVYATEIGEQRSVTLDDGSSVELNTLSRVKVRFTDAYRMVELSRGQALFRIAKDSVRPFVVKIGDARVRAVGTRFDVYRKPTGTVVTVLEGRVAVAASASIREVDLPESSKTKGEVLLQAGEQLVVSARAAVVPQPHPANIAVATAWTEKKLVFDGVPLREVVDEFNRYNRRQLVIRDPTLSEFHVSGVFASTDAARLIDILRRRFGVILTRSRDEIEISRPANAPASEPFKNL